MSYVLTINGVVQDLEAGRLSPGSLRVSWDSPRRFTFTEHAPHNQAGYSVEDRVLFSVEGKVHFRGRIKRADLEGLPGSERVVYHCLGLRELSKEVFVRDPDLGFPRVVFNAQPDDEDYHSGCAEKTVGEIIRLLFDWHASDLRAAGVIADPPATGYLTEELDTLAVVPPKTVFDSQNFDEALQALTAFQKGHRFFADPETQTWRFLQMSALPEKTVTYNSSDKPLSAILRPSTEGRATAVEIYGPVRPINLTKYLSEGGLTKLWNEELESDWTWVQCFDPENAATYGNVYRRFQISDPEVQRMARTLVPPTALGVKEPVSSPQVYRKTPAGNWAWVPAEFDFENGIILLAQPATVGDEYKDGEAVCAEDICLVYASLAPPLSARYPAQGYEGTAYTLPPNPVQTVRRIYDEDFLLTDQTPYYEDRARELLHATKDIVYAGTVRLGRLEWSFADLGFKLNFTGRDDAGDPVQTGFETLQAVLLEVAYDFAAPRTELALSTEAEAQTAPFDWRLRELETQSRRSRRLRTLQNSVHAPTPRIGNDGEPGADEGSRGVFSLKRFGDEKSERVSGHVELEAGPGITIIRRDEDPKGFRLSASGSGGQWYWFACSLGEESAGQTLDMLLLGDRYYDHRWYPVPAGRLTRVIAYSPQQLTAGTVAVAPSRKTRSESAPCPETRTDHDQPVATITTASNSVLGADESGVEFDETDVLGLRLTTSTDFATGGYWMEVIAAAYFEET